MHMNRRIWLLMWVKFIVGYVQLLSEMFPEQNSESQGRDLAV